MALTVVDPVKFLGMRDDYFWFVHDTDVCQWFKPLYMRGWRLRVTDGKLVPPDSYQLPMVPWHYNKSAFDCVLWSTVMFNCVGQSFDRPFIPSRCQNCFKVVIEPRTIVELFALDKLMDGELGKAVPACKCGIEVRDYVGRRFGGYVYGIGFEQGKRNYKVTREMIDDHPLLGPEVPVILKNGCTEMERATGGSHNWRLTEKQQITERWIEEHVAYTPHIIGQPPHIVRHIHGKWIRFAWVFGDRKNAELFTGGKPIELSPVTFHEHESYADAIQSHKQKLLAVTGESETFDIENIREEAGPVSAAPVSAVAGPAHTEKAPFELDLSDRGGAMPTFDSGIEHELECHLRLNPEELYHKRSTQ
jgi:hypothetical protein